jgi:tape measure domain-containing protein
MATVDEKILIAIEARTAQLEKQMAKGERALSKSATNMERRAKILTTRLNATMAKAGTALNGSFRNLGATFLAGVGLRGAQNLIDTSTRITNALKVAGVSGDDLTNVYNRLFASAQKNAAPLEALATLYGRAAQQQKELGVSSEQLLNFTDNVAVALRVAGTDAGAASGALLQLGQALGSGTVHAEEFNSILEGVPTIAQAAAAGIKEANGSVAALKQLVVSGKLSSRAFFDGFAAGADTLAARAAGAETTISGRFIRLQNILIDTAGKFDDNSGAAEMFGHFLDDLGAAIIKFSNDMRDAAPAIGEVERFLNAVNAAAEHLGKSIGAATGLDHVAPAITNALNGVDTDPTKEKLEELQKTVTTLQEAIKFNTEMGIDTTVVQGQLDEVQRKIAAIKSGAQIVVKPLADQSESGVARAINDAVPFNPLSPIDTPSASKQITLDDYPVTGGNGKGNKQRQNDLQREIASIKQRTATLTAETAAQAGLNPLVDDYGETVETARAKQELLNAAQEAGVEVTPEIAAQIDDLATAYGSAYAAAGKLADAQEDIRKSAEDNLKAARGVVKGVVDDLRAGKGAGEIFADVLSKIADRIEDEILDAIFDAKKAAGGGGIFSGLIDWIGSLFGGGAKQASAKSAVSDALSTASISKAGSSAYSVAGATDFIKQYSAAIGIDPATALRVAKSEGLGAGIWQSNYMKDGFREPSFGPFQLLKGGEGTGFPTGLGNKFMAATGLDPADPANWRQSTAFALDHARQNGWGDWYGAKAQGITGFKGIDTGALTQQQIAAQRQLAQQMQQTNQATARLKSPIQDIGQAAQQTAPKIGNVASNMTTQLTPALDQAAPATTSFGGALTQLVQQLLSSGGGGGAGLIGGFLSILGLADGGHVSGPGSSTSDSIPAWLSDGEYVVNAKATRKHRALLEAINSGRTPHFAAGGAVGGSNVSRLTTAANFNGSPVTIAPVINMNATGGTPEQNADLAKQTSKAIEGSIRGLVADELRRQTRPGNLLNNGFNGRLR